MPGTVTIPKTQTKPVVKSTLDRGWRVVLFDDDVTPREVVVFALQRAVGLSVEVAEMVTKEVEREGQGIAKSGLSEDDAKMICASLRKWSRIEGLCPGVKCEAQPDHH